MLFAINWHNLWPFSLERRRASCHCSTHRTCTTWRASPTGSVFTAMYKACTELCGHSRVESADCADGAKRFLQTATVMCFLFSTLRTRNMFGALGTLVGHADVCFANESIKSYSHAQLRAMFFVHLASLDGAKRPRYPNGPCPAQSGFCGSICFVSSSSGRFFGAAWYNLVTLTGTCGTFI